MNISRSSIATIFGGGIGVLTLLTISAPANAVIVSGTSFDSVLGFGNSTNGFIFNGTANNLVIDGASVTGNTANNDPYDVQATLTPGVSSDVLTVTYTAQNSSTDLFPTGFTNGSNAADLGGYFVGGSLGGVPISLDGSQGDFSVDFEAFNDNTSVYSGSTGTIAGPFNGSYGFNLGTIVGSSIDEFIITTTVQESNTASVPFEFSPTLGLLAVGGFWGVSRLRKRIAAGKIADE